MIAGGEITSLGESQDFEVVPVPGFSLGEPDYAAYAAFTDETHDFLRRGWAAAEALSGARERLALHASGRHRCSRRESRPADPDRRGRSRDGNPARQAARRSHPQSL